MNSNADFLVQAEIDYRIERMQRSWRPVRSRGAKARHPRGRHHLPRRTAEA